MFVVGLRMTAILCRTRLTVAPFADAVDAFAEAVDAFLDAVEAFLIAVDAVEAFFEILVEFVLTREFTVLMAPTLIK